MSRAPIYRAEALDRIASPEHLDELMQVVGRRGWLPLLTCLVLVAAGLMWSVAGRLAVSVEGRGVLMRPRRLVPFQAPAGGRLLRWRVRANQHVERGGVLATLDQEQLVRQLEAADGRLTLLKEERDRALQVNARRRELERERLRSRGAVVARRRRELALLSERLDGQEDAELESRRSHAARLLASCREHEAAAREHQRIQRDLHARRLAELADLAAAERARFEAEARSLEAARELAALESEGLVLERRRLERRARLDALDDEQDQLQVELSRLEQAREELEAAHERAISDQTNRRDQLRLLLRQGSSLRAEQAGRVIELHAAPGRIVTRGERLGVLEVTDHAGALVTLAYFPVEGGKRVTPGMRTRVSPDTVQRERFGSIRGTVESVSPFPLSREAMASSVGSQEVAAALAGVGSPVQVTVALERDPRDVHRFLWTSSRGPDLTITPGTTCAVRVIIEERAPISYVLPSLRELVGL